MGPNRGVLTELPYSKLRNKENPREQFSGVSAQEGGLDLTNTFPGFDVQYRIEHLVYARASHAAKWPPLPAKLSKKTLK
jgi:hypothetical protein